MRSDAAAPANLYSRHWINGASRDPIERTSGRESRKHRILSSGARPGRTYDGPGAAETAAAVLPGQSSPARYFPRGLWCGGSEQQRTDVNIQATSQSQERCCQWKADADSRYSQVEARGVCLGLPCGPFGHCLSVHRAPPPGWPGPTHSSEFPSPPPSHSSSPLLIL